MVRRPSVIPFGIRGWFPAIIITAIVSPIARPIPSTIPAITPDFAAGMITVKILLSCVAPRANAQWRMPLSNLPPPE